MLTLSSRPRRAALCAVLAVLVTVPAAEARPNEVRLCAADPRGDVRLTDTGPVVDAPHVDLAGGDVAASAKVVTVVIRTYGTGGDGVWKATFSFGKARYYALAATGVVASPLDSDTRPGFFAGRVGGSAVPAVGRFDVAKKEIRISVARRALGAAGPASRAVVGLVGIEAKQKLVAAGVTDVSLVDRWTC